MNRTSITIAFLVLIGLAVIGGTLIILFRPDASATFISMMITILGLGTTAILTISGINSLRRKVDSVDEKSKVIANNVNGNIARLIRALERASTSADHPVSDMLSEDTITSIRDNGNEMVRKVNE